MFVDSCKFTTYSSYVVLPEERLSWKTEGRSSAGRGNAGGLRDTLSRGYVRLESLWGYSFLILLVRDERFCLDEVFLLVGDRRSC